jgi:tRNA uridine 5-carboxymethylaminomethyl modification enzyme
MIDYDVIVVGAGHAGIEAAHAAAKMGCRVLLVTLRKETVGVMSCNPAIGGVGKGQLVREVDALGGVMGLVADECAIQFRVLNASKGSAVHSSRAQIDMYRYNRAMAELMRRCAGVSVKEAHVESVLVRDGRAAGVRTEADEEITGASVILCAGTFLDGKIHVGMQSRPGGRWEEPPSSGLSRDLRNLGFRLMRFKTGTCPRLDKNSIDWGRLEEQSGDAVRRAFSFRTRALPDEQVSCYITHTTTATHEIIRTNLDRSPLYAGVIRSTGVRYCPSIEDKVVRFVSRDRHQVFLEPQGLDSDEIYPNGLSTSLPEDVQLAFIRSVPGLEQARILRYGYGIEYTVIDSTQLYPTLASKIVPGLYCAGQINGTTGYEEAAAQGIVAGINAAQEARGKEAFILDRSSSYIGVLIDDLVTKGTEEPYRMFTSRVEYRLLLREDNADQRLSGFGRELGLLSEEEYGLVRRKVALLRRGMASVKQTKLKPSPELNERLLAVSSRPLSCGATLERLLRRPQVSLDILMDFWNEGRTFPEDVLRQIEIEVKYAGFIARQESDVSRFRHLEHIRLSGELDYARIPGISREIQEKLKRYKPVNLGQASRISGVTPAAISLLMIHLHKLRGRN